MNKSNIKIVPSGYRILKSLLYLLNSPKTLKELRESLSKNPKIQQYFTDETLSKIIHTLKMCDIEIISHKRKYSIKKLPWNITLSKSSQKTLFDLKNFSQSLRQKELYESYKELLQKIIPFLENNNEINLDSPTLITHKKFEKLMNKLSHAKENNYKIKIETKDQSFIYDTFTLNFYKNTTSITGYINTSHINHTISLNEIKNIKCLPQKASGLCIPQSVMLEITGKLKNAYSIKPEEHLIDFDEEKLIISNKGEDKKSLLKRILKYQNSCKITAPHALQEDYVKMLKDILTNYKHS